ncbi:MAG TPA: class I SAM-dependent methyltransferase [Chthoniobacterales bacterium]
MAHTSEDNVRKLELPGTELMRSLVQWTLKNPLAFELQQRLSNNYTNVRTEFAGILDRSNLRILDVGCSTGTCAGQIIDMGANAYTGVDVVSQYIEIAQRRHPRGTFIAMDARRMTFPKEHFDVAMFVGVLHHMDDELAADCLAEVRRVIRPGGYVVVAEPIFTPGMLFSNFLLSLDRGRYIRDEPGYRGLFDGYEITRQRFFKLSIHRFCSFVLTPRLAGMGVNNVR